MTKRCLILLLAALTLLTGCGQRADAPESPPTPEATAVPTPMPTPEPTPEPTATPEPTPEPTPDMSLLPVEWFSDAVFLGDSVSKTLEGYNDYFGDLGEPTFLCEYSFSVHSAINTYMTVWFRGEEWDALDVIRETGGKKLFIMLGINDIGVSLDRTMADWEVLLGGIRARDHEITFFIQSLLPMYAGTQVPELNNELIDEYNERLRALCERTGSVYVDLAPHFKNADNALREEFSSDYYVHLNNDGAKLWAALLRDPANYSVHPRTIDYENAYY